MKTKLIHLSLLVSLSVSSIFAQDKTTVRATTSDISDNLDLRAVATVFGDASNLEDFERRLNDPKTQISNLDLNNDNYVDYLRVIESVEGNVHLVVVQAVLDKNVYQDVATIEVERDSNNRVQVQVVGDVYMYGTNYIYEPVYVHTPIIYTTFWVGNYRPYYSSWYWGYYPSYYYYWNPFPIFRYRNHIHVHINFGHTYQYASYRRCHSAYNSYYGRRGNGYERMHPNRSFAHRNAGYSNRQELDNNRDVRTPRTRSEMTPNETRSTNTGTRTNTSSPRTRTESSTPRSNGTRDNATQRATTETRNRNEGTRSNGSREYAENRNNSSKERTTATTNGSRGNSETRQNSTRTQNERQYSSSRDNSSSRSSNPKSSSSSQRSTNNGGSQSKSSGSRNSGRG
jgi:hypothetical protein